MKPFSNIGKKSRLTYWTDEDDRLCAIVTNYSSEAERLAVLNEYENDGAVYFDVSYFTDSDRKTFFELWVGGKCVGLLSVDYGASIKRKNEKFICIELSAIFILKEYRGQGLAVILANTAAGFFENLILRGLANLRDQGSKDICIAISASCKSKQGENFCVNFAEALEGADLSAAAESLGFKLSFDIDVEGIWSPPEDLSVKFVDLQ